MQLNELKDTDGATKSRKRVGRGIGSGLGKTAGRGYKGQKSRSGVAINGFEGGQMPIHMRMPKRGFNKPNRLKFSVVNLDSVQIAIDAGKLDAKAVINVEALIGAGLVRRKLDGVRLLGRGELKAKASFEVAGATDSAIKAVEAAGGAVTVLRPAKEEPEAAEQDSKKTKKTAAKKK
ncbi:MAG: 50S ribosomal protein L15 [Alphaproteobacteria bacterium]